MAKNKTETPEGEVAPAAPAAPKVERVKQNGVTKPEGEKTGRVWTLADEISKTAGRPALREEVMAQGLAEGINKGTLATQYAKWTTFYNVSAADRKVARAASKPEPAPAGEATTVEPLGQPAAEVAPEA